MNTGLYIHFPFCVKKCNYCDFLSFPVGKDESQKNKTASYIESLQSEIAYRSPLLKDRVITSIFVGGGTPSLMPPRQIKEVMTCIFQNFQIDSSAEITWESNPGTLSLEKLEAMKSCGVNRLSMGLQSANDHELACLGRIHTWAEFKENYKMARDVGFENINIDLMSALPDQSVSSYEDTLKKVIALNPEHISAYSLIIEEGTPFGDHAETLNLPDEKADRQMYALTEQLLNDAGYERYEISNYAKAGYSCKHNILYWQRDDYLGLGLGASSLVDNKRFSNISDLDAYNKLWSSSRDADSSLYRGCTNEELLDTNAQMEEFMFLGLRLIKGIDVNTFKSTFKKDIFDVYGSIIEKHLKDKTLCFHKPYLALTSYGLDVSNQVMCDFLLS